MESEVVNVALHCLYRPDGSPEVTGEDPPAETQLGLAASFVKKVLLDLTSNVMSVFTGIILSQQRASQTSAKTFVLYTWLAIVPEA